MVFFTCLHKDSATSQTMSFFINKDWKWLLRELTVGNPCHQNVIPLATFPHSFTKLFFFFFLIGYLTNLFTFHKKRKSCIHISSPLRWLCCYWTFTAVLHDLFFKLLAEFHSKQKLHRISWMPVFWEELMSHWDIFSGLLGEKSTSKIQKNRWKNYYWWDVKEWSSKLLLCTLKRKHTDLGLIENAILFFVQFITFLELCSYLMQGCNVL